MNTWKKKKGNIFFTIQINNYITYTSSSAVLKKNTVISTYKFKGRNKLSISTSKLVAIINASGKEKKKNHENMGLKIMGKMGKYNKKNWKIGN